MRLAYALAWLLIVPLALLRLLWRARRQPGYLEAVGERFGRYAPVQPAARIWVHAVSVGETRAAAPIIAALQQRYPDHRILLTHMTPTGRATGIELFGDRVERAWLPYDLGFATRRFLGHYKPQLGIVLETEIWPRLLQSCRDAGVPVVLANGRLSERSARRYARVPKLAAWALSNLTGIAAQTEADARRFRQIGAPAPAVTGNVKFDLEVPPESQVGGAQLRARFGAGRLVWVAGSTREGEEALLLDAFRREDMPPQALLVLVPRHPQRFDAVEALARARGFETGRRSAGSPLSPATRVLLGDSMGEMLAYYAAADVAIMGGSLLAFGSQNLIEPCAMGKPVIVGPHTWNFEEAAEGAIHAGAAVRVADAAEALEVALAISRDESRRAGMGAAAAGFVAGHRGAVGRLMGWLETAAPLPAMAEGRSARH